jgi:hypothetical protein
MPVDIVPVRAAAVLKSGAAVASLSYGVAVGPSKNGRRRANRIGETNESMRSWL